MLQELLKVVLFVAGAGVGMVGARAKGWERAVEVRRDRKKSCLNVCIVDDFACTEMEMQEGLAWCFIHLRWPSVCFGESERQVRFHLISCFLLSFFHSSCSMMSNNMRIDSGCSIHRYDHTLNYWWATRNAYHEEDDKYGAILRSEHSIRIGSAYLHQGEGIKELSCDVVLY